jgi:tungstate transport system permease protein
MYGCAYFVSVSDRLSFAFSPRKSAVLYAQAHILCPIICGSGVTMNTLGAATMQALHLIGSLDPALVAIVLLSLEVSLSAVAIACVVGFPLGAAIAVGRFPGRHALIVALNALMGLPPVVVGLLVYLLLSRAGPLGALGLLFTPTAMVIAQAILIAPIVAALSRQAIEDAWGEYREQLRSLGESKPGAAATLLWEVRFSLLTVVLAGFGRAAAEVGAVMIVGGNIDGVTRVMTTTIALETSKGDLPLALGLGIVLLAIVLSLNAAAYVVKETAQRRYG